MKIEVFEGKEEKEVLAEALTKLNKSEDEVMYYVTKSKAGLLKKEVVSVHIATYEDIISFIKEYLASLTKDMGLEVSFESMIREKQITIKMYSDNNNILIGRNGQTLQALTTVVKQVVYNNINNYPYLILDVENYKEKKIKYLERLAKNIAREVAQTKNPVELENMNSYERRVIHNILTDNTKVYTESVGEEPNRHVVIKPKED
ncbi:MAG: KH domain-containing protein [Erysipelotrichales bacterium]|nr:KH domain-containing protein [Erysipelotrichales bacterium]